MCLIPYNTEAMINFNDKSLSSLLWFLDVILLNRHEEPQYYIVEKP